MKDEERIDDQQIRRAKKKLRKAHWYGVSIVLSVKSYNGTHLVVGSARDCADGVMVSKCLLIEGADWLDMELIQDSYDGHLHLDPPMFQHRIVYSRH